MKIVFKKSQLKINEDALTDTSSPNSMNNKKPARLHKAEPLKLEYGKSEIYFAGCLFIIILLIGAFVFGSENINYILWSCI